MKGGLDDWPNVSLFGAYKKIHGKCYLGAFLYCSTSKMKPIELVTRVKQEEFGNNSMQKLRNVL